MDSTYSYHKSVSYRSGFPLELNHVRILTVHVSCIVSLTQKCNVAANVQRNTSPGPGPSKSKSKNDVLNELVLQENIYVSLKTLKTFWHPATSPAKIFTFHNKSGNMMEYDSLILLSCQHCFYESQSLNLSLYPNGSPHKNTATIIQIHKYKYMSHKVSMYIFVYQPL